MKKTILFLLLLIVTKIYSQQTVYLNKLDLSKIKQEYGTATDGTSVTGEKVIIDKIEQKDVLGLHANAIAKIQLDGKASKFRTKIYVEKNKNKVNNQSLIIQPLSDGEKLLFTKDGDKKQFKALVGKDGIVNNGTVTFKIRLDGKDVYNSGAIDALSRQKSIDIDLTDGKLLELILDSGNDGASGDAVVLLSPQILYNGEKPAFVEVNTFMEGPKQTESVINNLNNKLSRLPVFNNPLSEKISYDWLINSDKSEAKVYRTSDNKGIVIANDMVARTFRIYPNLATVNLLNRMLGESMVRAVSGEGYIWINGRKFAIGGLIGQPERGYLKEEWLENLKTIPESFIVEDFEIKPVEEKITWNRNRWALNKETATGQEIIFKLRGSDNLKNVILLLHYAIYDKVPVIRKWLEVENHSSQSINIDHFQLEYLSFAEPESPHAGDPSKYLLPNIHIESDFACTGSFTEKATDITEKWVEDREYTSQRSYSLKTPCILQVAPPIGPDQTIKSGNRFVSFNVYEMPFDSDDRERKGLFTRRFYRTIAPWTTENPIFMHLTSSDPEIVRNAIDQCAEVGYEMIILSFGSGADAEDISDENISRIKELVDYAKSKGIEMGCYALLASRWISEDVDIINPKTGKRGGMRFGSSPCLCSEWGYEYFEKIKTFFEKTGMKCFEHDGSYPGDVCASTTHAYHKGLNDSQWNQYYKIVDLYHWMREKGIYLNVPDYYLLNGSSKVGIGYKEVNWSLPRDRQLIHTRQLNYDCTWERIPSSMWSFVPLVEYHGGGVAATIEPLNEHLYEYRMLMFQNYGAGIQACYRGPRLYDTPETKAVVTEIIDWYKKYRRILNSDIIHLRRPDARDWDGLMHVDPYGNEKGLAMFFNPTDKDITRKIQLPLYYTGLTNKAMIREKEGKAVSYNITRNYTVNLEVKIPANGYTWFVIE